MSNLQSFYGETMTAFAQSTFEDAIYPGPDYELTEGSDQALLALTAPHLDNFEKVIKRTLLFHIIFAAIGLVELFLVLSFLTFLLQTYWFATALGVVILTFFCYFVLRQYYAAQKPIILTEIVNGFGTRIKNAINVSQNETDKHILMSKGYLYFCSALNGKEKALYKLPKVFSRLQVLFENLLKSLFWQEVLMLREILLQEALNENLHLVKRLPTSLESHASLANAYVMFSQLYDELIGINRNETVQLFSEQSIKEFQKKFRLYAEKAIEEFKVLRDYSPNDPWVHLQLAYSYHDLKMPQEEIKEYETLSKLVPEDEDVLFKLGALYFEEGKNAQGLKIYERLMRTHPKKAEQLIECYR